MSPLTTILVDMETVTPSLISTDSAWTPVKVHNILHQHVPTSLLPSSALMMKMTRPSFSHSFTVSVPLLVADDYTNMSVFQTIVAFTTIRVSTDDTTCGYGDSHSLSDIHCLCRDASVELHDILHQHVPPSLLASSTQMMKITRPSVSHSISISSIAKQL